MITSNKGNTSIEGSIPELTADLSCIIKSLHITFSQHIGKKEATNILKTAYKDAFKSEKQLSSEIAVLQEQAKANGNTIKLMEALIEELKKGGI